MTLIVRREHVQTAQQRHGGFCWRGVATWLERYGMSLREFLRDGYPVERIDACGDEFGHTVARIARER